MAEHPKRAGGAPDDDRLVRLLAEPVWWGTAELRGALHRAGRCPVNVPPYSSRDPRGDRANCTECVHEHSEILTLVVRRYRAQQRPVADACGWARTVARNLACDRIRQRRAELGALARPERVRGAVAWILGRCPSRWHARLVQLLLDEVGKPTPVPAEVWPYDRWLAERARCTGEPADDRARVALRKEVEEALGLIRRYPGPTPADGTGLSWAERYVDVPLGRRPRFDTVSLEYAWSLALGVPEAESDLDLAGARWVYQRVVDDVACGEPMEQALARHLPARFGRAGGWPAASRWSRPSPATCRRGSAGPARTHSPTRAAVA